MNASIFYVGGSKGGVGKSKVAFALIDYLLDDGKKGLPLESDNLESRCVQSPSAARK